MAIASDDLPSELTSGIYGRTGMTTLPEGAATFSGDYVGLTVRDTEPEAARVSSMVTGDAALTVDFDGKTLTGSITNRDLLQPNGSNNPLFNVADATIADGVIADDGTFTATVSEGEFIALFVGTWTSGGGTVEGAFGGVDGGAAAGIVQIEHISEGVDITFNEIGSFVATQD